jgi:ribosomal protein S18 acetylase RimI-like enzyme
MSSGLVFRAALPSDAYALAELSIVAGDGMYEFLLEDMAPKPMLAGLMARSMKREDGGFNWRHCYVADDKGVVGMVNAFPAVWLREEKEDMLPQDKVRVLEPIDQAQDWASFLVNGIAVRSYYWKRGVGKRLLAWAVGQAQAAGFATVTANVWADNAAGCGLFESQGFNLKKRIEIADYAGLRRVGGNFLYSLDTAYVRGTEGH